MSLGSLASGGMSAATQGKLAMGMQGVGMGMSFIGAMNAADAQQSTLDYQSKVAANNAIIAGYQASIAKQVGEQQEQNSRLQTADLYGAQRASMAANGIDLGEGSATDILTTTKYMGERDALTIRDNTARNVWAIDNNAQSFTNQANAYSAQSSAISPWAAGAGSLLTSAGSIANTYYGLNKAGAFDKASGGGSDSTFQSTSFWKGKK